MCCPEEEIILIYPLQDWYQHKLRGRLSFLGVRFFNIYCFLNDKRGAGPLHQPQPGGLYLKYT